jgi:hypothetical protein
MDGKLWELDEHATPGDAQQSLLHKVEEITGVHYFAEWSSTRADWWVADLVVPEEPGL